MDVEAAAEELYAGAPGEFVSTRTRLAKQARADGDREAAAQVAALRRPTQAAWAVNLLVRTVPGQVEDLLLLGEQMRRAQATLAGEELRELTRQRQQVVAAMARRSRRLAAEAGTPVSEAVGEEVVATLNAALADPRAAAAVRSGRLVTAMSYAGMGEVDLDGVVALAPRRAARDKAARESAREAPAAPARPQEDAVAAARRAAVARERQELTARREEARASSEQARRAWDDARAAGEDARQDADRARALERELAERAHGLAEELQRAQESHREAGRSAQAAEHEARASGRAAEAAGRAARAAQAALADVERRLAELD